MTLQKIWTRQSVAVIGAGISGMGAAWALGRAGHRVTLFEKNARLGGHANTAVVAARALDGRRQDIAVDTGFIVCNDWNYPNLLGLFAELGVAIEPSDMSFSVSLDEGRLEWSGSSIASLFAQKRNYLNPRFHRFWIDILRFNRDMTRDFNAGRLQGSLGDYLTAKRYSRSFQQDYLLPMAAAIWSAPFSEMLTFPAASFARFFHNHGLLSVNNRPQWRTVTGGSRQYIEKLLARAAMTVRASAAIQAVEPKGAQWIIVDAQGQREAFDHIVFACHTDEALAILGPQASAAEGEILGAIRYQPNRAYLHQDARLMPRRTKVWSSWNYMGRTGLTQSREVSVTYWMNRLQNLNPDFPLFVSLNPLDAPEERHILGVYDYDHPLFNQAAMDAQTRLDDIQGVRNLWFAGAWAGYGFHEDGLKAGLRVALSMGAELPWAHSLSPAGKIITDMATVA